MYFSEYVFSALGRGIPGSASSANADFRQCHIKEGTVEYPPATRRVVRYASLSRALTRDKLSRPEDFSMPVTFIMCIALQFPSRERIRNEIP